MAAVAVEAFPGAFPEADEPYARPEVAVSETTEREPEASPRPGEAVTTTAEHNEDDTAVSSTVQHTDALSKVPTASSFQSAVSSTDQPSQAHDGPHDGPSATTTTISKASSSTPPVRRLPSHLSSSSEDSRDITTLHDPRKRAMTSPSNTEAGPDEEIKVLSTKLINAINCQTTLDDTLSKTRMELEAEREKVRKLEEQADRQKEFLTGGVWVRKTTVEQERAQFAVKNREERRLRQEAEEAKKRMEQELETLTAELFEQANKMVTDAKAAAQAEQVAAAKRYDSIKGQLADTESLLRSQQEQLAELKQVMEAMILSAGARDDHTAMTTPTSPAFGRFDDSDSSDSETAGAVEIKAIEAYGGSVPTDRVVVDGPTDSATPDTAPTAAAAATTTAATAGAGTGPAPSPAVPSTPFEQLAPSNPMSFTHLLRPVLRDDTAAYAEFIDLVRASQVQTILQHQFNSTHGRSASSTSLPKTPPIGSNGGSNGSTAWTASANGVVSTGPGSAAGVVAAAAGFASSVNSASPQQTARDLKDSKFYKRVLVEDIESTLRLDTAPGISWLVRRSIMASMVEGTLVAEPVPSGGSGGTSGGEAAASSPPIAFLHACALCGESRRQETYLRRHRFRLSESDKSTPYPLCGYCLGRVRAVCDFLVFLRMIKDGHWRADDEEAEHAAWEEGVRLREQMFWSRVGGGVLPIGSAGPAGAAAAASTRHSRITSGVHHGLPTTNGATPQPASSPLAPPPTEPGLGIVSSHESKSSTGTGSSDNATNSGRATPTHAKPPSAASSISASVAAIVSGLGGHVSS